jgi:DNA-binding HxlR family transcriptional regulator
MIGRYNESMIRETKSYGHFCLLARAMELLDDRWTVLVVRDLVLGRRRFTDLERRLGGITPKTLQQRLVDLELHGLVVVDREVGRRDVWYELTEAGRELAAPLDELTAWAVRFLKRPPLPREPLHYEHLVTALRVVLERTPPPSRPTTWAFTFDETSACTLQFRDESWIYRDGDTTDAELQIAATTSSFARYLTTAPAQRDVRWLDLTGSKAEQKLFVRLTDRFPFGLD